MCGSHMAWDYAFPLQYLFWHFYSEYRTDESVFFPIYLHFKYAYTKRKTFKLESGFNDHKMYICMYAYFNNIHSLVKQTGSFINFLKTKFSTLYFILLYA